MLYRAYGETGDEVSVIGFGGMRFLDQEDVDGCASLMKFAYDKGINYFDTAQGYGKSEELFGAAFKEMLKTRDERPFYVATKSMGGDPDAMRKDLETSLERMGLDYIDFFHEWNIVTMDEYDRRKANGVLDALEKFKEEGLIRHICLSTHMTGEDIGRALDDYPFAGVLLGYSAMNFAYREAGIARAGELRRGVVTMNPLGGGIIPQHPARFEFVRRREDDTVVGAALRFLINDERITVALVGLSTEEQVNEAVQAAEQFEPLSKDDLAAIRSGVKECFDAMCTGCRYCDVCPESIPVPCFMEAYNHGMLSGNLGDTINRLGWHWGVSSSEALERCTQCGKCVNKCTQSLPIMERFEELKDQFAKQAG